MKQLLQNLHSPGLLRTGILLLLVCGASLFTKPVIAQGTMGRWQMWGLSGATTSVNPTGVNSNVDFSAFTRGAGLNANSVSNGFRSTGYSTSGTLTIANNDYYEFTITPKPGYKMSVTAIKLRDQVSTTSFSPDIYLRYSDNSYGTNVVASWNPSTTATNRTLNTSGVTALQNRVTPVTFRIYGSSMSSSTSTTYGFLSEGTGVGQFGGVDIDGTVAQLAYASEFVSMNTGAAAWCAGETRAVSVTVKNVGSAAWTDAAPDVNIGVKWNTNGSNWTDYYIRTDAGNLASGATQTYNFNITASNNIGVGYTTPLAAGTNNLTFDVVKEGDCWFGGNLSSCGPGNNVFTSGAITITALPSITKGANPTVCQGITAANLPYTATTGTPNQYSLDYDAAANLAGFVDVVNAALPASQIVMAVPTGVGAGTYNASLTVRNSTSGCSSAAVAAAVTVTAAPAITLGADPSVCRGTTTTAISYTSTNSPNQYSIDYNAAANTAGFTDITNAALPGGSINLVIPAAAAAGVYSATLTVRNSTTGCISTGSSPLTVTVLAPTVSITGASTICVGNTTTLSPISGGTWVSNNGAVASVDNDGLVTGLSAGTSTFKFTETATGCSSTTAAITVQGNSTLSFTSPAGTDAQVVCNNTPLVNITYLVGGGGTGASVSGLPAGVSGSYNGGTKVFTISGIPTVAGNFNYTVLTTGPCNNTSLNGTIAVTTEATVSRTSAVGTDAQVVCIDNPVANITYAIGGNTTGASITAGALPAGVTGSYDGLGTYTISGTPTVSGVFNYTVTAEGSCPVSMNGTVTVNANSTLALTSTPGTDAQTLCINTAITNITYLVGGSGTGATVSGLPTGVTGSYNSGSKLLTITGSATVAGTFNYTVTTTGPCVNTSLGGSITVTGNSTLTLSSAAGTDAQSICQQTAIAGITYAIGGTGTGAVVSGLPAGVSGSFEAGVFTISGTASVAGVYNYTVTTAGPCVNPSLGGTITVNALPTAVNISPATSTICVNTNQPLVGSASLGSAQMINDNFNGSTGFVAAGTSSGNRSQIFGLETSGTNVNSVATFTNGTGSVMVATVGNSSGFGSGSVSTTLTSPVFSAVGHTLSDLTFSHTYRDGNSGTRSGQVQISTNGGTNWTTLATYTTNQGGSTSFTGVTIPLSAYSNLANLRLRFNYTSGISNFITSYTAWWAIDNVVVGGAPIILYSWTADTAPGLNGLPANAGTPSASNSNISVNPVGTTMYTLTAQSQLTGCGVSTATSTITVTQDATINQTSAAGTEAQVVCIDNAITGITYAIGGSGTGATVSGLPAGVVGSYNAGVYTISGIPTQSGTFNYTVTSTGPCVKPSLGGTITVIANSTIALSSAAGTDAQSICINNAMSNIRYAIGGGATSATLSGSLPNGVSGSFSAGVITISGTPTESGMFNYTVTTVGPCVNSSLNGSINVIADATIALTSAPGTSSQVGCYNAAITNITYTVGGGALGTVVTGLPAGVNGLFNAGTLTISGVPTVSGTFNYTVTTTGTCIQTSATGSITVNDPLTASHEKRNASACGPGNDGNITVAAQGGSGSYNYSWTAALTNGNPFSAGNTPTISGLGYGFYNVSINDANGCGVASINNIHIENAYFVHVTNNGSISALCAPTGSILLYGNAGIKPYTYSLDGITYQSSNTFTNLAAGSYTGYVKDAAGCVSTKAIQVGVAAPVAVTSFARASSSCAADGSIELYRTGGINPYTYSIDGITYQNSNKFLNLAAGNYTGYVMDSKGCVGTQSNIIVTQGSGLAVTAGKSNTSTCVNDGSFQLRPAGGIPPYSFSKDDVNYQPSPSFTGLAAGSYTGWVKDSRGCKGSLNITIAQNPVSAASFVVNATDCASSNGSIQLFRIGGVGPYTYSLDGDTYQTSNLFTGLTPGEYDGYVKDSKTCVGAKFGIIVGPACETTVATKVSGKENLVKVAAVGGLKINVYPNPSATEFTLQMEGVQSGKVRILVNDVMGRTVYQAEGTAKQQYRFGRNFIAGMYNVQVIREGEKQNIKLVKE